MLNDLIPLGITFLVIVVGFVGLFRRRNGIVERRNFVNEYLKNLDAFASKFYSSGKFDTEIYDWLVRKVVRVQNELGSYGVVSMYRPAYENFMYKNYQIFANTIPAIIRDDPHISRHDVQTCLYVLTTYLGWLDDLVQATEKELRNPLAWLREGAKIIVVLPFLLLAELGLIGSRFVAKVQSSFIIKLIAGLFALAAVCSSIVTIVIGWNEFIAQTTAWFHVP